MKLQLLADNMRCLLTARRYGFACVTNDKRMRNECQAHGIRLVWGLEMLSLLCQASGLPAHTAVSIAREIRSNNPRHISSPILQRFENKIRKLNLP